MIKDYRLREYFLVYNCLAYSPSANMILVNTKEYETMGDVNILAKSNDLRWGSQNTVSDSDVYCRLYFCESLQDVLDIFADGQGDVDSLYDYLMWKDEKIALEALLYIYNAENKLMKTVSGESYKTCPESVKKNVVSILKNRFFEGMYDEFFDEANFENAKLAWDLDIPEIRKEFIRDDHSLAMLKKIL